MILDTLINSISIGLIHSFNINNEFTAWLTHLYSKLVKTMILYAGKVMVPV